MKDLLGMKFRVNSKISGGSYRAAVVLEVVLVIAILIAIAILFNAEVRAFAVDMFSTVFGSSPAASIVG